MTIAQREDALFAQWQERRPYLVQDGLVDEEAYLASSPRVVLVLKDVNDEGSTGRWDLRSVLRTETRWQTWNTVTRWMRGLRALDRDLPWAEVRPKPTPEQRLAAIRSIGVVNLKKEPGAAASKWEEVQRFAREDADLFQEQLALYQPDLIICGGVGGLVREALGCPDWQHTSRGLGHTATPDGCPVFDYYHPQARFPQAMLYYTLIDGVRSVLGKTEQTRTP